ncbi:MAG: glycosyltransferase family 39 protein [Pirellulales bacterium]|nr:glycosyltransferase family 39 protein [Pirellulales bacterium]
MSTLVRSRAAADPAAGSASLWSLVLAAMVLRMAVLLASLLASNGGRPWIEPDSAAYLETARSLALKGEFSRGDEPEVLRTPGYPLLLALGAAVGRIEATSLVLQVMLGGLSVALVYLLAKELQLAERVALTAAALASVEPLGVLYAGKLLSETLFAFVLLAALVALAAGLRRGHGGALCVGFALLVAAAFVRPIAVFLPLVIWVVVALRSRPWLRQLPATWFKTCSKPIMSLCLIGGIVPAGLWAQRNADVADYRAFSAVSDVNAYFWHAAGVYAKQHRRDLRDVQREWGLASREAYVAAHPEQRVWSQGARYRWMRKAAREILESAPGTFIEQYGQGLVATLIDPGSGALIASLGGQRLPRPLRLILHALAASALAGLYLAALAGLVLQRSRFFTLAGGQVLLVTGYLLVLSGGPVGYHRLRHPVMPLVCVWAAPAWASLAERSGRTRPASSAAAI